MPRPARFPLALIALAMVVAVTWTGWLSMLHVSGQRSVVDLLEAPLTDLRLRVIGPQDAPDEIVIIAIDDATVASEGGYPLDRRRLALLVRNIAAAGATTVALDILLVDPTGPDADAALAEALDGAPSIIAAAGRFGQGEPRTAAMPTPDGELWPLPQFVRAAAIGLANVATDAGGTPRHLPLLFRTRHGFVQGFALRAAAQQRGAGATLATESVSIGAEPVPLDIQWHLPLRFYGPAGTIRTISAQDVLTGEPPSLSGSLAVIGVTATGVGDTFPTPFDTVTPGVEIQATGIAHLLHGEGLVRTSGVRRADASLAMLLSLGGVLLILLLPLTRGLPLVAIGLTAGLAGNVLLFANAIWASAALPLVAAFPPIALAGFVRQLHERHVARTHIVAETALRRFQPTQLADRISSDPTYLREPVEQPAAVLFLDLTGFTWWSEQLGPARTQTFLKQFHTLVVDTVALHQGVVMNFMGDGALTVFGVVEQAGDPAGRAFDAAMALADNTRDWVAAEQQAEAGTLGLRLGLHFGPVILARLGHEAHQQISVSGDTVNLASRLMEIAKAQEAAFAVSTAALRAIERNESGAGAPDAVQTMEVRGHSARIEVALWKRAGRPTGTFEPS